MSYKLKIDFTRIRCYRGTLEKSSDEIGLLAIGCDQEGHFTFFRPRIIARGLEEGVSNSEMALTPDKLDTTMVDINLTSAKRTGFLLAMWMYESDNPDFLRNSWNDITQNITSAVNARAEELRKLGVPDEYRYHMGFSESFHIMHLNMASGIGRDIYTTSGGDSERTGALVQHELFHPVLWRFTHPALLESSNRPVPAQFKLPNYNSGLGNSASFNLGHVSLTNAASSRSEALYVLQFKVDFKNLSLPVVPA